MAKAVVGLTAPPAGTLPGGSDDADETVDFMDEGIVGAAIAELGGDPGQPPAAGDDAVPTAPAANAAAAAAPAAGDEPAAGRLPTDQPSNSEPAQPAGTDQPPAPAADAPAEPPVPQAAQEPAPDGTPSAPSKGKGDDAVKVKFAPEQQAVFDREIKKEVGRRQNAEEELDDARGRIRDLRANVKTLERQVADSSKAAGVQMGLDPLLLADSVSELDTRAAQVQQWRRQMRRYRDTGYEGDGEGGRKITLTAEQVTAQLDKWDDELTVALPAAREHLRRRAEFDEYARSEFPTLFEEGTEEFAQVQQLRRTMPWLWLAPSVHVMIGDMIANERARLGKAAAGRAGSANRSTAPSASTQPAPVVPSAPTAAPGSGPPAAPKSKPKPGASLTRFVEAGATKDALEAEAAQIAASLAAGGSIAG